MLRSIQSMGAAAPPKPYLTHEERTAAEPRHTKIHQVVVDAVEAVNPAVRTFRLRPANQEEDIEFRAGQWLDVFVPGLHKAGGFTITSTPHDASTDPRSVELAIQDSPRNPPAAWLWRSIPDVINQQLSVRVGGNFTWPPPGIDVSGIDRVYLIAGGVGINPIMSMLSTFFHPSALQQAWSHISIDMTYTSKIPPLATPEQVLFWPRIQALQAANKDRLALHLHLTNSDATTATRINSRRPCVADIEQRLHPSASGRQRSLFYVCGPQAMTDEFVSLLSGLRDVEPGHVLCEKWW